MVPYIAAGILFFFLLLVACIQYFDIPKSVCPTATCTVSEALGETIVVKENTGSATSGKLFKGDKVRSFSQPLLFQNIPLHKLYEDAKLKNSFKTDQLLCDKWSVVTTIFEPADAVRKQALVNGWCLVVVGDKKGPFGYKIDAPLKNFVFLSMERQLELEKYFPIIKVLPWNHFGRKNVGFLYAILHGAKMIWDFDDDNILNMKPEEFQIGEMDLNNASYSDLLNSFGKHSKGGSKLLVHEPKGYPSIVFNPYPPMGMNKYSCWPRGYPLERIKWINSSLSTQDFKVTASQVGIPLDSIGIIQSLANHDPDVDAIYRLTQPLPFDFPASTAAEPLPSLLLVPWGSYSPYNAQATLHFYSSLWSLLLPVTVHGRVSDIWRGYFAQRLGFDIDMRLAFSSAVVTQYRNSHNYLADFQSEEPLYTKSLRLVEQLIEWKPTLSAEVTLPGSIEELWVMLYEHDYIGLEDVLLVQAWLHSLIIAGYKFPIISKQTKRN